MHSKLLAHENGFASSSHDAFNRRMTLQAAMLNIRLSSSEWPVKCESDSEDALQVAGAEISEFEDSDDESFWAHKLPTRRTVTS